MDLDEKKKDRLGIDISVILTQKDFVQLSKTKKELRDRINAYLDRVKELQEVS